MFKRLRRFFSRIKDALKELIFGDPVENDKVIDIEVVTETVTDADGNIIVTKTEKVNTTSSWKDIWKKCKAKVKLGVEHFIDDPRGTIRSLVGPGAVLTVVGGGILTATRAIKEFTTPIRKMKENREKSLTIYDDTVHGYYSLRRPLTNSEKNLVYGAQARRGDMHKVLEDLGVLA